MWGEGGARRLWVGVWGGVGAGGLSALMLSGVMPGGDRQGLEGGVDSHIGTPFSGRDAVIL